MNIKLTAAVLLSAVLSSVVAVKITQKYSEYRVERSCIYDGRVTVMDRQFECAIYREKEIAASERDEQNPTQNKTLVEKAKGYWTDLTN